MKSRSKLRIFDEDPMTSPATPTRSSLRVSNHGLCPSLTESKKILKMNSCKSLPPISVKFIPRFEDNCSFDSLHHIPLDQPLFMIDQVIQKTNTEESLFKDIFVSTNHKPTTNFGLCASQNRVSRLHLLHLSKDESILSKKMSRGNRSSPKLIGNEFCLIADETPRSKSPLMNEKRPMSKSKDLFPQVITESPKHIVIEQTEEISLPPQFYSEITNVKGRQNLITKFRTSIKKLKEENRDLHLKMLNSEMEELKK
jgi:hypothetical protein